MDRQRLERICAVLAITIAAMVAWHFCAADLDAQTAFFGLSPEEFTMTKLHPEFFAQGFPSSSPTLGNSLAYNVYPLFYLLGVPINVTWSVMILLEILAFILAATYAARILMPTDLWLVAAAAGLVVAFGSFWTPDLANFHYPYYGWSYNWSFAAFLMAVAETARNRLWPAAIWIVLSFTTHPVIGVLSSLFVAAMVLSSLRTISIKSLIVPILICALGCGLWTLYISSRSTISGDSIDLALFAALNKAQNFHWYPIYQGTFWEEHTARLMPLLSMLLLLLVSLNKRFADLSSTDRKLVFGMMVMAAATVAGVLISLTIAPPVLVKLALHRADSNLLLAGFFIIFRDLYQKMAQGSTAERLMAAVLFVAPFTASVGMPAWPVLFRAGWEFRDNWRRKSFPTICVIAVGLALAIVILMFFYWAAGVVDFRQLGDARYSGVSLRAGIATGILATLLLWPQTSRFPGVAVLIVTTILTLRMAHTLAHVPNPGPHDDAYAMLDAELWARDNTAPGSLFMLDPGMQDAWRGKSYRPSFGVAREWLLYSILYNSSSSLLEEGLARYRALGLEAPPPYIFDKSERRRQPLYDRITRSAQQHYYGFDKADFTRFANTYGIRYFVFQRRNLVKPIPLDVIYENPRFLIAKAPAVPSEPAGKS